MFEDINHCTKENSRHRRAEMLMLMLFESDSENINNLECLKLLKNLLKDEGFGHRDKLNPFR